MNKLIWIMLGTLMFAVLKPAHAESTGGIVAHAFGTVTGTLPQDPDDLVSGDLVTCQATEILISVKLTYLFLEGVCDDGSGATHCAGRVTALDEECLNPGTDLKLIGLIVSQTPRGQFRICFDNSAQSDCSSDTPPYEAIIGKGPSRAQVRLFTGALTPAQGNVELDVTSAKTFRIDGAKRRLRRDVSVGDFTLEPDKDSDNCGGVGCGIAATFVSAPGDDDD